MTTATEQVDLEALEQDARRTLEELTEARARLSLDALSDARVAAELEDVESEIRSCEQALERVGLASGEQGRRAAAAVAAAAREAREAAAAAAAELSVELEMAGREVDAAFAAAAVAVEKWLEIGEAHDRESVAAGRRPGANAYGLRAIQLAGAFRFGMRRLPPGVLATEGFVQPRHVVPLAPAVQDKSGRANQKGDGEGHGN